MSHPRATLASAATRLGLVSLAAWLGPSAFMAIPMLMPWSAAMLQAPGIRELALGVLGNITTEALQDLYRGMRSTGEDPGLGKAMAVAIRRSLEDLQDRDDEPTHREWFEAWLRLLGDESSASLRKLFGEGDAGYSAELVQPGETWWPHVVAMLQRWKADADATLTTLRIEPPPMPPELARALARDLPSSVERYFSAEIGKDPGAAVAFQRHFLIQLSERLRTEHLALATALEKVLERVSVTVPGIELALVQWRAKRPEPIQSERDILDPAFAATKLLHRDRQLDEFMAWLTSEPPIAVRTVIGPAGVGKTRFALGLLERVDSELPTWLAGFASSRIGDIGLNWSPRIPLLVVFDYASQQRKLVSRLLHELQERREHPRARFLLLERYASRNSGWLSEMSDETNTGRKLGALIESPIELEPLNTMEVRRLLFRSTLEALTKHLGRPMLAERDRARVEAQLNGDEWRDPLVVMMAALVASAGNTEPANGLRTGLARTLAQRERKTLRDLAPDDEGLLIAQLAAHATLAQDLTKAECLKLASTEAHEMYLSAAVSPRLATDLLSARLGLAPSNRIAPLTPDVIGEAFLLTSQEFDAAAVGRLQTLVSTSRIVPTLIRTIQTFASHVSTPEPDRKPLEWLESLLKAADEDALRDVAVALPSNSAVLQDLAIDVERRLVELASDGGNARLSRALTNLAVREGDRGRWSNSVETAEQAVDAARGRPGIDDGPCWLELARALSVLASRHSAAGNGLEALAAAKEASEVYETLAENPEHQPGLALSLSNLATHQGAAGTPVEALSTARRAKRIARGLAATNPDVYLRDWARAVSILARQESEAGLREDGIATAVEATELCRELVRRHGTKFLPDLMLCLNNLAGRYDEGGQSEEALRAATAAAEIARELADAKRDEFLPELARALTALAGFQRKARLTEAATTAREGMRLFRELVGDHNRRPPYLPDLVIGLAGLAGYPSETGEPPDAQAAIHQAVRVANPLLSGDYDPVLPDVAKAFEIAAIHRLASNDAGGALVAARMAIVTLRSAFLARPRSFEAAMRASRETYARTCDAMGTRLETDLLAEIDASLAGL